MHMPVDEGSIAQLEREKASLESHTGTTALATRGHSSARLEDVAKKRTAAQVAEYKQGCHHWKKKYSALKRRVSETLGE